MIIFIIIFYECLNVIRQSADGRAADPLQMEGRLWQGQHLRQQVQQDGGLPVLWEGLRHVQHRGAAEPGDDIYDNIYNWIIYVINYKVIIKFTYINIRKILIYFFINICIIFLQVAAVQSSDSDEGLKMAARLLQVRKPNIIYSTYLFSLVWFVEFFVVNYYHIFRYMFYFCSPNSPRRESCLVFCLIFILTI